MRHIRQILCAFALGAPALVLAAGSATVQVDADGERQSMLIEFAGPQQVRMSSMSHEDGYMLFRDGHLYAVAEQDGKPLVMDMGGMLSMFGKMGQVQPKSGADDVHELISLKRTGGSETVAGVRGSVYLMSYLDGDGQTQTRELVLSSDARAREYTEAMFAVSTAMASAAGKVDTLSGAEAVNARLRQDRLGVLRAGDEFRIASFGGAPSSSRLALPAAPQQLPDMSGLQMGGSAEASSSGTGGFDLGAILGGKAKRQQDRVEQRSDQEVDEATDSTVDKALDKAFDTLFGR